MSELFTTSDDVSGGSDKKGRRPKHADEGKDHDRINTEVRAVEEYYKDKLVRQDEDQRKDTEQIPFIIWLYDKTRKSKVHMSLGVLDDR